MILQIAAFSALPQARFDIRSTLDPADRRVFRIVTSAI